MSQILCLFRNLDNSGHSQTNTVGNDKYEEQNLEQYCSNLMPLDTGDKSAAVGGDAGLPRLGHLGGGLRLQFGGALGVEVDLAAVVALHLHKACVHVREVDGGTEKSKKHSLTVIFHNFAPGLDEGRVGWGLPARRQAGLPRHMKSGLG